MGIQVFVTREDLLLLKLLLILNYKARVRCRKLFYGIFEACKRKKFGITGFYKGVKAPSPPGGKQLF